MSFGDFNHDGHTDGRDYIEYKIATGDTDNDRASGIKRPGNIGCFTFVLIVVALYVLLELIT